MLPFDVAFPELAAAEVRTILVQEEDNLPVGTYLFRELYCAEPRCDCRRVMLNVYLAEEKRQVATVSHGFEPPDGQFDDEKQTFLDPLNVQSELADAVLETFEAMIKFDPAYVQRLIRHYELWKSVVDDETHPLHWKVRVPEHDDPRHVASFPSSRPYRRAERKVGPNERCPCGSGRKYKVCCKIA